MPNGFLDVPDVKLLTWSQSFSDHLTQDAPAYGVTFEQAADYAQLHAAFADAMQANLPQFRSKSTTLLKNEARAALVADARLLVNRINSTKGVTDSQKIDLGLPVRSRPTKVAVPEEAPMLVISNVRGHTVWISLSRTGVTGVKPPGVLGATLFRCVSEEPPSPNVEDWQFVGNFGKNTIEVDFPSALPPGAKVWLAAQWVNTRLEAGPLCAAVPTNLQGGQNHMKLKQAA